MGVTSEIKDKTGKVHTVELNKLRETLEKMVLVHFVKGRLPLDEECEIRQGDSEWFRLTKDFREKLTNARGDIQSMLKQERDQKAEAEAILKKRQKAQAKAIEAIHQLKAKCASGEWSLDDLQYIFQLVSNVSTTPSATSQEVDELAQAQNELINEVCKNPALSEPLKIMYSNAQLEQNDKILSALGQLSNDQSKTISVLQQSQKTRNLAATMGVLGATKALSELGDISDALGGDE
jgi:hypothetical protein